MHGESTMLQANERTVSSIPPASAFDIAEIFDNRYALRRLLARSAGATVYAAEHRFTHRRVAVKVPHESTSGFRLARVRREVEVLALVRGEGIVEMMDAGEVGGRPYIVFELLEGRTVAGLLAARGTLRPDEVIQVGIDAARALERCHERGVIHRDVKPSNLFATRGGGSVKLLDFGIAKRVQGEEAPHVKLTQETAILGTPEYMSPESLMLTANVDQRADIYALGVTLYECLTGSVPFEGEYGEVLFKISSAGTPSVREKCPEAPEALCNAIDCCLSRAPEQRYRNMSELRNVLEAFGRTANLLEHSESGRDRRRQPDTLADAPAAKLKVGFKAHRRHPRAPYTTLARITSAAGARVDGRIEEVSEGGLQFVGERAFETGTAVRIRFALPASGRVAEVGATARWQRSVRGSNASGFQFDDISESVRAELRHYVEFMGRV